MSARLNTRHRIIKSLHIRKILKRIFVTISVSLIITRKQLIANDLNCLLINAMRGGEHMSVRDQHTPAILNRALPEEGRHPRPLFRVSRLATHDPGLRFCGRAASSGSP